jgi:hypothetical protein
MPLAASRTLAFAIGTVVVAAVSPATAKAVAASPYSLKQTYGASLRLLRVDLGLEVTEKDENSAYLMFAYRSSDDPKRTSAGAIELIALENEVRIVVKIPAVPEAHERILRDRLVKKLREDFGDPPRRKPSDKPAEPTKPPEPSAPTSPDGDAPLKPKP